MNCKDFEKKTVIGETKFEKIEFLDLPDHIIRIDTICLVLKGVDRNSLETLYGRICEDHYYIEIITKIGSFIQGYDSEDERDSDFIRIKSILSNNFVRCKDERVES